MVLDPKAATTFCLQATHSETQPTIRKCLSRTKFPAQEAAPTSNPSNTTNPSNDQRCQRREELQTCISWLLEANAPASLAVEKRAHRRFPFRRPITITPVSNATGRPDQFKSFPAFGIDISATGICFLARQLVPVRKAVLSMEGPGDKTVALLFEPRWVRFTRGGWYQTGGRLLEVMSEDKDVMPVLRFMDPPTELLDLCENARHP